MNSKLIKSFELLIADYRNQINAAKKIGDTEKAKSLNFKVMSFLRTLKIIKSIDFEIENGEQLKDIKGIGKGVISRINEIINQGYIEEIKHTNINNTALSLEKDLIRITGIGPAKAKKLLGENITLEKLQNGLVNPEEYLTHHQIIGLKYLEAIEERIPYEEISNIEIYLKNNVKKIDNDLEIIICGSYRRKQKTSGDIDVLVYSNKKYNDSHLKLFIKRLSNQKFLIDHLTKDGDTKYMGMCQYKLGTPRRIDIRYIKKSQVPSAMLYFTGSGDFNKNMRVYANKKGFKLNEYGIFKLNSDKTEGLKMNVKSEKDIFKTLELDYVDPENRKSNYKFPKI